MEMLTKIFDLILMVMQRFIDDGYIGSLFWLFIIATTICLTIFFMREI